MGKIEDVASAARELAEKYVERLWIKNDIGHVDVQRLESAYINGYRAGLSRAAEIAAGYAPSMDGPSTFKASAALIRFIAGKIRAEAASGSEVGG